MFFLLAVLPWTLTVYSAQQADLQMLYGQAKAAEAAGDFKAATARYERIVAVRPDLAEAYANLGRLYFQQEEAQKARESLQRAIKLKPEMAGPYFFLGVLAFNTRQYREALTYLGKAETLDPSEITTTLYLGYTNYALFNYLEALRDFQRAAKVQPDDLDILYYLSKSYGEAAKYYFSALQRLFPGSFYTHLARGHAYEVERKWEKARTEYSFALSQQAHNPRLQQRLAWVSHNATGQPPAAPTSSQDELIDGSLRFLNTPPEAGEVRSEFSRYQSFAEQNAGGGTSAERTYALAENCQTMSYLAAFRVFESDPGFYRAHQLKGLYYEELGKDEEALKEYQATVQLRPDLPDLHFEIGNLYWKRNRLDEALPELMQELRIQPDHPQALYEAADVLYTNGKLQEAEQYLLRTVKFEPNMAEAHFALARIYTATGRYSQSVAELKETMVLTPDDPDPHYRMAVVLRKMGKPDQAQRELEIFVTLRSKMSSN
jgi:tetratricopeptide (TPR) repeat protein